MPAVCGAHSSLVFFDGVIIPKKKPLPSQILDKHVYEQGNRQGGLGITQVRGRRGTGFYARD
jgi:hypothetical protein